jgi:arylsulfatase
VAVIGILHLSLAADVLPQSGSDFKGGIRFSVKDSVPEWPPPTKAPPGAPNIVLILLDDVGFGAVSVFGGPVRTPELEQLAATGLRYNRFHVTALCSPTRAALLSGRNDHRAGFGTVSEGASGFPGYTGIWRKDTVMISDVLRRNGYSTAAFGKWHNTPNWEISPVGPFDRWPTSLGFEYFYGFMAGKDSQWEPSLYRNTTAIEPPATLKQGYHFTTDITTEAIRWVHTHDSLAPDKPFFLYFATGATHDPHHVPKEWIDKYRGAFDQGWDKLREASFAQQKKLGVIPGDTKLTPRPKELPAWDSLSADQKKLLARQMEVFAGFLAHTDHEVGRLVRTIQRGPQGDNTLILYIVGDNGASGEGGLEGHDYIPDGIGAPGVQERLRHIDELGGEPLINDYATAWAWATNAPFQWTKQIASHFGGTRDPLIVSWPARIMDRGGLRDQFTHVNDVAATLYEVTGVPFPSVVDGVEQQPLDGTSFAYSFDSATAPSRHRTQIFEQVGNRAIYQDGWVAAARHTLPWQEQAYNGKDFEKDRWELYRVETDFSEADDLAALYPQKLKELQAVFDAEAHKNNVYPLGAGGWSMDKGQPSPVAGRREFVYYPDLPRTRGTSTASVVPDFLKSHRITADVVIPETGAEGVIISEGSRYGGFVLYVKDNHLVYENNSRTPVNMMTTITSQAPLPYGRISLAFEYARDEATEKKTTSRTDSSGTGRLYVNGQLAGEAHLTRTRLSLGSFGVGQAFGSPVSPAIVAPFRFSGTLEWVKVELK